MKVLYGVQATGNGHIARARVMAPALAEVGVDVDYLFSGRPKAELFDMACFGDYTVRRGLTFCMGEGAKVLPLKTLLNNNLVQLYRDVRSLDVSRYDLVISDFEPVTAWSAKLANKASMGVAHQYAFLHALPDGYCSRLIRPGIKLFAPVKQAVGIHWDSFDALIAPPLISPARFTSNSTHKMILVYMPYEVNDVLFYWFSAFPDYEFRVYSKIDKAYVRSNVVFRPLSRDCFEKDLSMCEGVISNCGFGLASEAMQYGKKFLSKPMKGQAEQQSNARILKSLGLATIINELGVDVIEAWLQLDNPLPKCFPNVAAALSEWIASERQIPLDQVVKQMWS
ncbi:glycosyltransferase family protein [Neptunomonas japonica]|uniref:Glycosyl transferase n=1 Tax=Neptunomonas japonica JAMM 1380 TaxID=1441457 RepID=A0A7R6PVE1_9GAMM|nr:glycosyltransferase family protein [Neptunomonas japonica]BBB31235.1 glycosyl transferase [Neptunomonas japonica JAMM 1380]